MTSCCLHPKQRSDLVEKPALCLVNKMDTDGSEEKLEELKELLGKGYENALSEMEEDLRPRRRDAIQFCDFLLFLLVFFSFPLIRKICFY